MNQNMLYWAGSLILNTKSCTVVVHIQGKLQKILWLRAHVLKGDNSRIERRVV